MAIIDKVNINGYELSYAKFGKGSKPFVMIPGVYLTSVLNSADAVEEQYSHFFDEYTIYLLDNCAKLKQNDTIDVIVDHDIYLLDKLGIKDAYVLATSHGGLTSMLIASKRHDLIKKLIVASSCCKVSEPRYKLINEWINLAKNYEIEQLNRSFYENLFSKQYNDVNKIMIDKIVKIGTNDDCDNLVKTLLTMKDLDISNDIRNITCDVLAIGAEKDVVFGPQATLEIASIIPNAHSYIYNGYYHAVYDEAIDYKQRIEDFYNE